MCLGGHSLLSGGTGLGIQGGVAPGWSNWNPLCREMVMSRLTNCCRRSANVSYKYSKVRPAEASGGFPPRPQPR